MFALAIPGEEGDDLDGVGVAGDGERPCLHAELVTQSDDRLKFLD